MRALVVVVLAASACVNNYVVRDDEGEDDGGSTTCVKDECGMGDTAAEGVPIECMPCESDVDCGDAWDNCVRIDVIGPQCLFACPEAGCPPGQNCRNTLSMDDVEAMQCTPHVSTCDPAD